MQKTVHDIVAGLRAFKGKRIVVGLSGGVDSSVVAWLMKQAGAEVTGAMMQLYSCNKPTSKQTCCSGADQQDAFLICEQIGIPFKLIDMREHFQKEVIDYFVDGYTSGKTPNPCVKCNETTKFAGFKARLDAMMEYDFIATGHYARIDRDPINGRCRLFCGEDSSKDQSYFLWTLSQEMLAKTIFPIGDLKKEQVRAIAIEAGLKTAAKAESQDICFVPDGDYAGFISDYYPEKMGAAGDFVDTSGKTVGRHAGIHAYTLGKRRGLGFGVGQRQYVVGFDLPANQVIVGDSDALMRSSCTASGLHWIGERPSEPVNATIKIRYSHAGISATITPQPDGTVAVAFSEPQRAVTPGQAMVIYREDEVLGGGWIE